MKTVPSRPVPSSAYVVFDPNDDVDIREHQHQQAVMWPSIYAWIVSVPLKFFHEVFKANRDHQGKIGQDLKRYWNLYERPWNHSRN